VDLECAGAGRVLGAVDVVVGVAFLDVMAFETITWAEWSAFWQLAYGASHRLVWALALVVLGAYVAVGMGGEGDVIR
jgi:hypothetical protein